MDGIFDINLAQFSFFKFLGIAFFGVILYFVFWFVKNYLIHLIIKSPVRKKHVIKFLPVFYTLFWCFYFLYVLYFLIRPFPLYGMIISLIIIYLARSYLLNLVNGLFFRFKGNIVKGQKISFKAYSGVVTKLKTFDLVIENKKGERIIIPYATIAKENIVLKNVSGDFYAHKFSLVTNSDISTEDVHTEIMSSPWISSKLEIKISKTRIDENQLKYNILVHTLDEKYNYFVENDLRFAIKNK